MQPPIGVSNFREMIETRDAQGNPFLFVDKSLFIKEVLDDLSKVRLITRPRRFGKTLNMSMLHHFFANEVDHKPTKALFDNLKITKYPEYIEKHQGKYPVINLTFKDIKSASFEAAHADFFEVIRSAYLEHEQEVLSSPMLGERDKNDFRLFLDRETSDSAIRSSLKNLTFFLSRCYGIKPIVLIDEYDTPIQTAYAGGYYKEMVDFMKGFLGAGLKDNSYLERAILSGILRVSKESIFSELNNVKTYSLLHARYGEYFGFTEPEVIYLLEKTGLKQNLSLVKDWYNGYQVGTTIIYNPWSLVNYIQDNGRLDFYWIDINDNELEQNILTINYAS